MLSAPKVKENKNKNINISDWESPRHVVSNVLDCDVAVSEFEFQLRYYV